MATNRYRFWATLLDSYTNYLNSEAIWEKYWGWSENPPHTPEEYAEQQFQNLIDSINRVDGVPSEPEDKGTCFNEIIDCLIAGKPTEREDIAITIDKERNMIVAFMDGFHFEFPIDVCRDFAKQYTYNGAKCVSQYKCEAELQLPTATVTLYGYIDELMPSGVHDIKTTRSYNVGKYLHNWQHRVYPYCLWKEGVKCDYFQYDVMEINGKQYNAYKEFYPTFNKKPIQEDLEQICTEFIGFIEEHRHLITFEKLFT